MAKKRIKIEGDGWYSLVEAFEIVSSELPIKDFRTLRAYVDRKMIKATTFGTGKAKRYHLRGKHIIEFIAKFEAGDFHK